MHHKYTIYGILCTYIYSILLRLLHNILYTDGLYYDTRRIPIPIGYNLYILSWTTSIRFVLTPTHFLESHLLIYGYCIKLTIL